MEQTKLSPVMIDTKWPKYHRIRKMKNKGSDDYYSEDQSFDGIMKSAKELGRDTNIVLYSGGKDSGKILDMLDKNDDLECVLHLDTKTGVQVTQDFVKDECTRRGIKLFIRTPTPLAELYVAFCLEFGFPSVRMHRSIMKMLKFNSMIKFIQEPQFKNKKPALIGGIRKFESKERMGNYNAPITRTMDIWFVNPIFYESNGDVYSYFIDNKLSRTPAYETLGFSGECNCGAFAQYDEAKRLEQTDKKILDKMRWIEFGIEHFGSPEAKKHGKWGRGEYGADDAVQQEILERFFTKDELEIVDRLESVVCGTECGPGTMKGMLDY